MADGRYRLVRCGSTWPGEWRASPPVPSPVAMPACASRPRAPGAIAGSTATMAGVVRHAVAAGLPVTEVAAAASTTPARVLGLGGRTGALRPGLDADLVVCDEDSGCAR